MSAVRRVEDDGVHVLADERIHTLHRIARDAYAGGYAQTALAVLAGVGVVLYFGNILIGNQSDEFPLVVHDGQLLDLVVEQHVGRMGQLRRMGGDEVLRGHHLRNQAVHVALETQVAAGDVYFARQHLRIGGYEQDVIERESGRLYPLIDKRHNDWGFCCAQK